MRSRLTLPSQAVFSGTAGVGASDRFLAASLASELVGDRGAGGDTARAALSRVREAGLGVVGVDLAVLVVSDLA